MAIMKSLNGNEVYDAACRQLIGGITTAGTGSAYTAQVNGIESLTAGVSFVMVPHTASTTNMPTLKVNSLAAKQIRQRLSNSPTSTVSLPSESFISANKPIRVVYDGTYWIIDDMVRPNVDGLYGTLPIESGGTNATTASGALNNLGITWGTSTASSTGTPNSIYIQIN